MDQILNSILNQTDANRLLCKLEPTKVHLLQNEVAVSPCKKRICDKCFENFLVFIGEYISDNCLYECILCEKVHDISVKYEEVKNYFKNLNIDYKDVYMKVLKKIQSIQLEIKERYLNRNTILNSQIDFLHDDIQIYVESIKAHQSQNREVDLNDINNRLDENYSKLLSELETLRNEILKSLSNLNEQFNVLLNDQMVLEDDEINEEIRTTKNKNDSFMRNLRECEFYLNFLKQFETEFDLIIKSIQFNPSDINDISIGQVVTETVFKKINWKHSNRVKYAPYAESLSGICTVRNDKIVITDQNNLQLIIINKQYEYLSFITAIDDVQIGWVDYVCSNKNDKIYACVDNRILILNDECTEIQNTISVDEVVYGLAFENSKLYVLVRKPRSFINVYSQIGDFVFQIEFTQEHLKYLKKSRNDKLIDYEFHVNKQMVVVMINKPDSCYSKFFIYDLDGNFKCKIPILTRNLFYLTDKQLVTFFNMNSSVINVYDLCGNFKIKFSYELKKHGGPVYARDCIDHMTIADDKLVLCELRSSFFTYDLK